MWTTIDKIDIPLQIGHSYVSTVINLRGLWLHTGNILYIKLSHSAINEYWYRFFKTNKLYLLDESYYILIYTLDRDPPEHPNVWYPLPYKDV